VVTTSTMVALDAEAAQVGHADLFVRRPAGAAADEDVAEGDCTSADVGVGVPQFPGVAGEVDVVADDDLRVGGMVAVIS